MPIAMFLGGWGDTDSCALTCARTVFRGFDFMHFLCSVFWVDGAAIKNVVSGAILARPCEMGLFHRGCLIDDDRDLRGLSTSWDNELRLRLEVTIFIPK